MAERIVRVRLDPFMVLMPATIIAFAISMTLLVGVGPTVAGFALASGVVLLVAIGAANYLLYYSLAIIEGNLRLSKYAGLPAMDVPLGSIQGVSVSARPAGRMLGKITFATASEPRIEIAPRLWRKTPLNALVSELRNLGVDVDDGVWAVVDRG